MDIFVELRDLLEKLNSREIPYALCGGFALAVYNIARATQDIDLLIEDQSLSKIQELAEGIGYRFDRRPLVFKDGALQIYRLHKTEGEDFLVLDLLVVSDLTRPAWDTRRVVQTDFGPVHVVSPAGLIHLKSLRGSGQDQDDIRRLKDLPDEN
jgi:Nucleotidyl transferase AbiEii toxin, Type IV TA system